MATTTGSKRLLNISSEAMAASNSMTYGGLNVATEQYVSTQVSNIISSAPGALDTLNELAAALGDDPNFATTITNSISTKLDASVNPLKGATVSNDTITFTRADNTTFAITTSDANTDTNYYLNGITRSGNTLTFSVSGTTNRTYTFGSAAWAATTDFDASGAADGVNNRIDNEIIPLINGKADASHTHAYLPLAGGTITGSLTVSGSETRGTYTSLSQYHSGADNIVLKGNSSGISSIFFESEKDGTNINHPSDFGFIQYHAYGTSTSGESNELIIGVSNDADDHVIINAPDVNGLKFRTGVSATDYTIYHSGNLSLATLGYTGASNANYITNNNQLTNGAGYITGVSWANVSGKPSTFTPSAHTHAISEVDGLETALDGKQAAGSYLTTSGKAADSNLLDGLDSSRFLYTSSSVFSGDWNTLTDSDYEIQLREVQNITGGAHSNYPEGVYSYGSVLAWQLASATFKLYSSHTGDLVFQTGWNNDGYSGWRTIYHSGNFNPASYLTTSGKAADSNLLDGINSTSFLRSDANDTMSGVLTITGNNGVSKLRLEGTTPTIDLDDADGDSFYIHVNSNNFYVLTDRDGGGNYGDWETPHPFSLEADTNSTYLWGNKVGTAAYAATSDFDAAGAAAAVDQRIDTDVLPAIPTNNNQLTNGAGYITSFDITTQTDSKYLRSDVYDTSYNGLQIHRDIGGNNGSWTSDDHTLGLETQGTGNIVINFHRAGHTSHNLRYNGSQFRFDDDLESTGVITATGGNSSNWNTAYGWGDHAGLYDAVDSSLAVNSRIDTEVLPAIPTNNNQLTNGAGYITSYVNTQRTDAEIANIVDEQLVAGSNINIEPYEGRLMISASDTNTQRTDAQIRDVVSEYLRAGTNISVNVTDTIFEIAANDTQRTDAQIRDVVSEYISAGPNISFNVTDTIFEIAANDTTYSAFGAPGTYDQFSINSGLVPGTTIPSDIRSDYWMNANGSWILFSYTALANKPSLGTAAAAATTDFAAASHTHTPAQVGLDNLSASGNNLAGNFTATGDITAFSDARVKENVETISNALESVKEMRGVTYNKIGEEKQSLGVIAQELEEIMPQVVHTDEEGMKSVAYGNITAVLIEAIKEQQKQIDELKAKLDGLTK